MKKWKVANSRGLIFPLLFLSLFLISAMSARAQSDASPAPSLASTRAAHLRRGINLSNWFGQVSDPAGYTKQHFETAITTQDLALIRQMGFDHVRLPIDPAPMFHLGRADQISSEYLTDLDTALKMILDQNLCVIVDIHPSDDFKHQLAISDTSVEEYADFWRAFAQHYASLDPDKVFFEILNEPELQDPYRWYGVQTKLADAIREGAPRHTIIATGAHWSDDDDLVFLEPIRDPNVIYNFHFYEPHLFTHQGATWSVNYWRLLSGLSYPSDPANAAKVAESIPDAPHRLTVIRYGYDQWNADRIDADFKQVSEWAHHWNVPIICDEFGAFRKNSDPSDRAKWLTDVRTGLEKFGIGWAIWDYDGGFAVVNKQNGQTTPDALTLHSLALQTHRSP
jgi:aryl-phospho-beta-D-glucosidase BglC (GH1 family)